MCDELITVFGEATEPELQAQVANALSNKAFGLYSLRSIDQAVATYDDLIARFETATDPALAERVQEARLARTAAANSG